MGIKELRNLIKEILVKHGVRKAGVFGSFATGGATTGSDIDILVDFKGEKSLIDLVKLKHELQKRVKKSVDVVTYGSLNPLLKKKVLKEAKPIL